MRRAVELVRASERAGVEAALARGGGSALRWCCWAPPDPLSQSVQWWRPLPVSAPLLLLLKFWPAAEFLRALILLFAHGRIHAPLAAAPRGPHRLRWVPYFIYFLCACHLDQFACAPRVNLFTRWSYLRGNRASETCEIIVERGKKVFGVWNFAGVCGGVVLFVRSWIASKADCNHVLFCLFPDLPPLIPLQSRSDKVVGVCWAGAN